jgi:butyrate kinase
LKKIGLWVSKQDLRTNLQRLDELMKLNALKTQIKFRKKVLKSSVEDKTLLQFSSNGIPFNLKELISHLERNTYF